MTNSLASLVIYVLATGGTLGWVFLSKQTTVPRTGSFAAAISARLACVVTLAWLLCYAIGAPILYALLIPLGLLILAFSLQGPVGGPIVLPALALGWAVQQFVLGFPDRKHLILEPKPEPPASEPPRQEHVGSIGTAISPLRPLGRISLDGAEHDAVSFDRGFFETGAAVIVRSANNNRLVVAAHAPN